MIPKVIHYCWFGNKSLDKKAIKCIESWKKFCPDYEIKEWNENNFDINCCDYVQEAYKEKKWAFVSDYARFYILYHYGGLYFDVDVELIAPIDDIIEKGPFMACEPTINTDNKKKRKFTVTPKLDLAVNPGLGLAANPGLNLYKEILENYNKSHFKLKNGEIDQTTVVIKTTNILVTNGFITNNVLQTIAGINIYPSDYFCPMNYHTGVVNLTENTRSIHHYNMSWKTEDEIKLKNIERKFRKTESKICFFLFRCFRFIYKKYKLKKG